MDARAVLSLCQFSYRSSSMKTPIHFLVTKLEVNPSNALTQLDFQPQNLQMICGKFWGLRVRKLGFTIIASFTNLCTALCPYSLFCNGCRKIWRDTWYQYHKSLQLSRRFKARIYLRTDPKSDVRLVVGFSAWFRLHCTGGAMVDRGTDQAFGQRRRLRALPLRYLAPICTKVLLL